MKNNFDVIVIGAGHAGCESALASARLGCSTLLLCANLEAVAFLACNPSIGGTAKGQIVKEIDALGGQMGLVADDSLLQLRMLNRGKGAAVHSPRAQVDKHKYHANMKRIVENTPNLTLRQAEAVSISLDGDIYTVSTRLGLVFTSRAVVVASGVYLNSSIVVGSNKIHSGPSGFSSCDFLSTSLVNLGLTIRRFKTGTPARINARSIDFSQMAVQGGEQMPPFSYLNDEISSSGVDCYLTYSSGKTKDIILANKHLAPIYNGTIEGTGPRYCPSIEDKVIRFSDKDRHQIFLEPEGEGSAEYYVQGVSSSMPLDIQQQIYQSIVGLENVEIMRDAYAIEYDCIDSTQLYPTLMFKEKEGLFFAGQICGTSGYEEAAAQGLVCGINSANFVKGKQQLVLSRSSSYIGVLIDDITTKGTNEPYRMMTSRAEHRLYIRQDNADMRLCEIGRQVGLVDDIRYAKFSEKVKQVEQLTASLSKIYPPKLVEELFNFVGETLPLTGISIKDMLKRSNITMELVCKYLSIFDDFSLSVKEQVEINTKYEGYIDRERKQIEQTRAMESKVLPQSIDYTQIQGLRIEAREKLNKIRPLNLGQASRVSGVSPSDIQVLILYLNMKQSK